MRITDNSNTNGASSANDTINIASRTAKKTAASQETRYKKWHAVQWMWL